MHIKPYILLLPTLICQLLFAQKTDTTQWWHGIQREIRYQPDGTDFVITNGNRRFTRALYGTNTAFRVEAGDLPEFALYMPGMGGNIKFGIINKDSSKWLINAENITARYRPGMMLYDIEDALLGKGKLHLEIICLADAEGVLIKATLNNAPPDITLFWTFGGASGKKFSRDGDMGPDPESVFYLKPEYCGDNRFEISKNSFQLAYGSGLLTQADPYVNRNFASDTIIPKKIGKTQFLTGCMPPGIELKISDANSQQSPNSLWKTAASNAPVITGKLSLIRNTDYYFSIQKPDSLNSTTYESLKDNFILAEKARQQIAEQIKISTPDKYINTLGGVLGIAADAIWESPTYLHGSIGWRMRLNGWRGPYVADVLGWHDRAKTHFRAYALSQVKEPVDGPVIADTALHLARSLEKMGTSIFSSGYISRNPNGDIKPHHYDMNLVYIDALIRHLHWTGDMAFAKEMWPVITRHLAWEKRNFDPDDDGLYDAYACIWASDALQYSGGAGTHSSAYNFYANKQAAAIALLIGEDASKYQQEADKIVTAINKTLWIPEKGTYAEFKDLLGNKFLHAKPAVWTLYHSIDSQTPDAFQAYQSMRYIDQQIPHIPVRAKGLEEGFQTISTSRWMPYDWSLNNVATAEVMHTALANWQTGRNDEAFKLFKSELLSTMYLGGSPGNIGQISFFDANRGEAYRDFADPVAMTSRSVVEGLFGIKPNGLQNKLLIEPGFPSSWAFANISTPDIAFDFKSAGNIDSYHIVPSLPKKMNLHLLLKARKSQIASVTLNGRAVQWKNIDNAINNPKIELLCGIQKTYNINIVWKATPFEKIVSPTEITTGSEKQLFISNAVIHQLKDPQKVFSKVQFQSHLITGTIAPETGSKTLFVQLKKGKFTWWQALSFEVKNPVEILAPLQQQKDSLIFTIKNNTTQTKQGILLVNDERENPNEQISIPANGSYVFRNNSAQNIVSGSNNVSFSWSSGSVRESIIQWNTKFTNTNMELVQLNHFFNDKVTNIFKNEYLSPRPKTATLQLPTQGIGDWTHPLKTAIINDSGLRKLAGDKNEITLPQGIRFNTPSDSLQKNILFTSQWDNYPTESSIPLSGKASQIYLLLAGSTNPMQSRMINGAIIVKYADNTSDTLLLKNPENWYPIEQDYLDDGFAFQTNAPRPPRLHLKTGKITSSLDGSHLDYNGKMIEGGAATVVDLPLNKNKSLKELVIQTWANDVVIGLMAATLVRP
jgi:hypothetical protein